MMLIETEGKGDGFNISVTALPCARGAFAAIDYYARAFNVIEKSESRFMDGDNYGHVEFRIGLSAF